MDSLTTIFLLEPNTSLAERITENLLACNKWLNELASIDTSSFQAISVEVVSGVEMKLIHGIAHSFYDESLVCKLAEKINNLPPCMNYAILANPILTPEEYGRRNTDSDSMLIKEVVDTFKDQCPISYVTGHIDFGTRSLSHTGPVFAGMHYIPKSALYNPTDELAVAKVVYYLYFGSDMPAYMYKFYKTRK